MRNRNIFIAAAIIFFGCLMVVGIGGYFFLTGPSGLANIDQPANQPSLFTSGQKKDADKTEDPQSEALPESQDLPDPKESEGKTLSEACWAIDPQTYKPFLHENMKQENGLWTINYPAFVNYAKENDAYWQFEGHLPEYKSEDRTDIFFPFKTIAIGEFKFVEGSFWLYPSECAESEKGQLIANDRTGNGKWNGRREQNLLEGFTMVIHDPSDADKGWTFTVDNPYSPITAEGAETAIKSCKGLKEPQLQKYFGELGSVENYSFGAIGCNSVTIGNFPTGYGAMLFKNANDNIGVVYDEKLEHYIFPANWDAEKIQKWLDKNYPNIPVFDPEGVLK